MIPWFGMQSCMAKKIRIHGLVKFANRVRDDISHPVSPLRLSQLKKNVKGSLESIDQILQKHGLQLDSLPPPSQKACTFLRNIDFDTISAEETALTKDPPANSVSFPRLTSYFNHTLEQLARINGDPHLPDIYHSICTSSRHIEGEIQATKTRPEQLKSQTRAIRGWLAYFAQRENFDSYQQAIREAGRSFSEAANGSRTLPIPVHIHFLPIKDVYRANISKNLIRVKLPTPMICFDRNLFHLLAEWIFRKVHHKQIVLDATLSEPYQEILAELDLLGGMAERTEGVHHNLADSFERVNQSYFQGSVKRPRLAWSQTFTSRQFGHYDRTHDTIMVSMSLDRKDVPDYVTDFVVYHELLHKVIGSRWSRGRNFSHTPEFTSKEKRFRHYQESKAILHKLARPS